MPSTLCDSASTEFNFVSTVSDRAAIIFLRSGLQPELCAHTLLLDTLPTPPAAKLPRMLSVSDADGLVGVVFTSRPSTAQHAAARRTFTMRRRRLWGTCWRGPRRTIICRPMSLSREPPSMLFLTQRTAMYRKGFSLTQTRRLDAARNPPPLAPKRPRRRRRQTTRPPVQLVDVSWRSSATIPSWSRATSAPRESVSVPPLTIPYVFRCRGP